MSKRVYWDSCCFIDWIENRRADRIAMLRSVIDAAINDEVVIVASTLALAEVVRCNGNEPLSDEDDERIKRFFNASRYIEMRVMDRRVAAKAREIHRETLANLGPYSPKVPLSDCIHIATALLSGCSVLHTFDEKHLLKANNRFGAPKLPIERPSHAKPFKTDKERQLPLFGDGLYGNHAPLALPRLFLNGHPASVVHLGGWRLNRPALFPHRSLKS